MNITLGLRRTGIYSMLLLFLATTFIALVPAKVYAAAVDSYDFTNQLVSYKLYYAMADCVGGASLNKDNNDNLTDAAIASGDWYENSENVITGIVADPQVPPDGRMECNTIVRKSLAIWGFDDKYGYVETAKKMGFQRNSKGHWSKNSSPRSAMLSFIRAEIYGGSDPVYKQGFNYYDLFKTFTSSACQAKKVSDGLITTDQKALGYKQITVVDTTTNTAKAAVYSYENETIDYGAAPLAGSDRRLECTTIANNLKAPVAEEYVAVIAALPPGTPPPGDPGSNEGTQSVADECPLPDDTSMRWLGCSIMSVAKVATESMYAAIQNFLYTPTAMIFDNEGLKEASAGIRNLAIGLILIAGLVMVIAQASGSELVDAYTLRKLIPRIGVAIIGIALAWPLLKFAITLTNDVGLLADRLLMGVTQLGGGGGGSSNDFGTNVGSVLFGTVAGGGALLFLGAAGVISLAGTILLALLLGLLVLSIRQLVIMVCVLIAPLAIAAYVLPGTQKLWAFWKNTLITSLIMFPIIMFFLASGKAMAAVLGGADSATMSLLAVIVFIAPYFLLPFAFKLAGGLMATIFSIANDKNRGMFDRLKKGRQQAVSNNVGKIRSGTRYAGGSESNFRGKLNRGLANTANAPGAIIASGNTLRPGQWGSATTGARTSAIMEEMEKHGKDNAALQPWKHDDGVSRAAAESDNEAQLRANLIKYEPDRFKNDKHALDQTVSQVMSVKRQMSSKAFKAMTTLQAVAGGTAYKNNSDFVSAIAEAGMGDEALTAHLTNQARSMANSAGRYDQGGASFGTTLGLVSAAQKRINGDPVPVGTPDNLGEALTRAAMGSQSAGTFFHPTMKAATVENVAPIMASNITSNLTNEGEFIKHLATASNAYDTAKTTSPEKAEVLRQEITGREIRLDALSDELRQRLAPAIEIAQRSSRDPATGEAIPVTSINIQQAIEGMRGDPLFQQYGREYTPQALNSADMSPQERARIAAEEAQRRGNAVPGSEAQRPPAPPVG